MANYTESIGIRDGDKVKVVRINREWKGDIDEMLNKYPQDFKTAADVIRAGIKTLKKWKADFDLKYKTEDGNWKQEK